jgi:hypothetical protein
MKKKMQTRAKKTFLAGRKEFEKPVISPVILEAAKEWCETPIEERNAFVRDLAREVNSKRYPTGI